MSYIVSKLIGYLRLLRPANIITAIADVLAGVAISGYFIPVSLNALTLDMTLPVVCLCLATIGLYGGGVVFNDVFDAELDKVERPERPIPDGVISKTQAVILGSYMLLVGILAAFAVGRFNGASGWIALAITASALIYDKWGKHSAALGPVNMGLCRGLNLLLGVSIVPAALATYWWVGFVPVVYIAAITNISRGEVFGGDTRSLKISASCYIAVFITMLTFAVMHNRLLTALPFILLFAWMVMNPLMKAMKDPIGPNIGKAVKAGIVALVVMNAAWVSAFATLNFALAVLLLLPVSIFLGKIFAVT
ncbi:MAG TPA: UbiA-like protein EboC [Chitinophaga sp.]|uniref:UbiA-like protein EboC n=1 Tax=Chitinophaga sp. TaxID=1869181 RepID=UPI002C007B28|nr:UbiA-like protein EboC [Chitinophaga sp.]HVI48104.1 UbiA-like protein EboC [Chitinophaga sp.]